MKLKYVLVFLCNGLFVLATDALSIESKRSKNFDAYEEGSAVENKEFGNAEPLLGDYYPQYNEEPMPLLAQTSLKAKQAPKPATKPAPKAEAPEASSGIKRKREDAEPVYYSALGLAKNIPDAGYYRVRNILRFAKGSESYDGDGKEQGLGYSYSQNAFVFSIEYALSDRFAMLFAVPYLFKNSLELNTRTFKESSRYQNELARYSALFRKGLSSSLKDALVCGSDAECDQTADALIRSDSPLPQASTLTLPTGETVSLPAGTKPSQVVQKIGDIISTAATPSDGVNGLGDFDFGISYSFINTRRQIFDVGAGIRLPLGSFDSVPASQLPVGSGLIQYGVRVTYDLRLWDPLIVSLQDQFEGMIIPGRRKKSSLLDPNKLNEADPTSAAAIAAGSDGSSNAQKVTKEGVSHNIVVRADLGLGVISRLLQPIDVEVAYNKKISGRILYDGTVVTPNENSNSISYGMKFDGIGLDRPFPAYLRVLKEDFLSGTNVPIALNSILFEVAIYQSYF